MKAILVIDMPKCCGEPCPCWNGDDRKDWCGVTYKTLTGCDIEKERPSWCLLRPLPEQMSWGHTADYIYGYNDCLAEITGETE